MTGAVQLSDAEILRLEQLLDDPALPEAMRLDEAQGYLCAALSGPQPLAEAQWLIEVLGSAQICASAAGSEAADLLRRLAAALEAELADGQAPVLLLYAKESESRDESDDSDDSDESDYAPWCQAYLHGIDTAAVDWFDALGAQDGTEDSEEIDRLDEQLFPLFVLTGDAEAAAGAAGEDWLSSAEIERLRVESAEKLPQAVAEIYRFWVARDPLRRPAEPGENS